MNKLKDQSKEISQNSIEIDRNKYRDLEDKMRRSSGQLEELLKKETELEKGVYCSEM